jgi:hypothetical protein
MSLNKKLFAVGVGSLSLALVVAAVAVAATGGDSRSVVGPGMMGSAFGAVGGGGTGATGTGKPSAAQLTTVRDRVNSWLAEDGFKGFKVSEVMAFTNNDYIAVRDASGKPAFELLTDLNTNWLMEEPPSMMWNIRYGVMGSLSSRIGPMMGGSFSGGGWNSWSGTGNGKVAATAQAVAAANKWLAKADPGERAAPVMGGMGKFPGYYTFDTTRNGKTYGMLSVNASTGAVWYHGWHGTFLSELDY